MLKNIDFPSCFAVALVAAVAASLFLDHGRQCADAGDRLLSLCREDQVLAGARSGDDNTSTITSAQYRRAVLSGPAQPFAWAAYADALDRAGEASKADGVWKHATGISGHTAPIYIRASNYYLIHGKLMEYLSYNRRVLEMTSSYNAIIFRTFLALSERGLRFAEIVDHAVPRERRAAAELLEFLVANGANASALNDVWHWMAEKRLSAPGDAGAVAAALIRAGDFRSARNAWMTEAPREDRLATLANGNFSREPLDTPFDWKIEAQPGVTFERKGGLLVRFLGQDNIRMANVRQCMVLDAGHYRIQAEVATDSLSTDQRPFLEVFDLSEPIQRRWRSTMLPVSAVRHVEDLAFRLAEPAQCVCVQLVREKSGKFNNRIAGTLRIISVRVHRASIQGDRGSASSPDA